jgi:2-haloacid dehalogenase
MSLQKNKPVLVFDVNETLLDMTPLKQSVNALLGNDQGFRIWFGMLLHYSIVSNSINEYHDFGTIAGATLSMAATSLHKKVSADEIKETLSKIQTLQAYPDVEKGLKLLKDHGFRLVTLTNSPPHALKQQLINSNLTEYFEQALSIDSLKKYKPEVATYLWAAKELAVEPKEMLMIAAHGWDLAGASHAGLATCFIAREGQSVYTLSNKPDFEANDILAMAEQLVTAHSE